MTEQNIKKKSKKFHKDTFDKTTEDRRQKVLETAIEEFAAKGYNATSINDISRKSNISIGSLYSYFASKEDLFLTIVNNAIEIMESILNDILERSNGIFDCVERMLVAAREFAQNYQKLNQIYLDITTQGLSQLSIRLSDKLEIMTPQLLSGLLRQAKEKGD
jgi:AcrR family transcriptional regulator